MRVLLVDDHAALREALLALLATEPSVEVVGEAADGAECLRLAETTRPDLVLMDVRMPVVDGIEATRTLRRRFPEMRVIALTSFQDAHHVAGMITAGASGYLLKTLSPGDLREAIRAAADGRPVMAPDVFEQVLEDVAVLYRTQEHRAERLASGGRMRQELLTLLSDDLRNPLTAITGAASTLARDWHRLDDATRQDLLGQVEEQSARLQRRVDEVIATVGVDAADGVFVLSEAVREALGRIGDDASARLAVELEDVRARGDHPSGVVVAATLLEEAVARISGEVTVRTGRDAAAGRVRLEVSGSPSSADATERDAAREVDQALAGIKRLLDSVEGELEVEGTDGALHCAVTFEEAAP